MGQNDIDEKDLKHLEGKIENVEKRIDDSSANATQARCDMQSYLDKRIDDARNLIKHSIMILSFILAVLAFIGWQGFESIAQKIVQAKVDKIDTEEIAKKIINEQLRPLIISTVAELDKIKTIRKDLIATVEHKELSSPLKDKDKESLNEIVEITNETKKEDNYTYDDWFLKGVAQYESKNYESAAKSFIKAYEIEKSITALGNAALAFKESGDYDKAEEYYKRAIEANPNYAISLGNYANFLHNIRKNNDKAEELYKRALEADPNNAINLGSYAVFLYSIREDNGKAEEYYKRAIEANPNHAINLGNYALLLEKFRKNYDKAEELYKRALEADPNNAINLGNYAVFMHNIHKNKDKAEELYKRALEADPNNAINLGNYALFMQRFRKNNDKAEEYYKKALKVGPKNVNSLGNYAVFLHNIRKDYNKAEEYYKRAIDTDPKNANNLGNYAGFLLARGERKDGFEKLETAQSLAKSKGLTLELWFYIYAHKEDKGEQKKALAEIKKLIVEGERAEGFGIRLNVERAIEDGHHNPELLTDIERVIYDKKDAGELEKYEEWKQA